ncbi:hypothetical protein Tco_0646000 [Tanacetum coccineum]
MDVPPSPDHVVDFPAAELEPHPAYDFFTAELIPGLVESPDKMNGWIKEDGPLGADLIEPVVDQVIDEVMEPMENPDKDVDMLMDDDDEDDDDEGEDDEDGWEVNGEWLMAPVMPPPMLDVPPPSTFKVGRSSTAAPGLPFLVGRPFLRVVSRVAVHHEDIGGLSVQIKNLEHAHDVLVKKIGDMSDA